MNDASKSVKVIVYLQESTRGASRVSDVARAVKQQMHKANIKLKLLKLAIKLYQDFQTNYRSFNDHLMQAPELLFESYKSKRTQLRQSGQVKKTNKKERGGATVCGQSCMDNTSNGLNETNDSSITETTGESLSTAPYCCQVPKFLRNLSLLPRIFCPPDTIAIASSAWRTFSSSLIDVFSFQFVLRCFRFRTGTCF